MKKKRFSMLLCLALLLSLLGGCGHEHEFAPATCTEPETCECGETQGEPLGHAWADASCTEPKTCTVCGTTEGEALGHDMAEASYDAPATCQRCGLTAGEPLSHDDDAPRLVGDWECAMPAGELIGKEFTSEFSEAIPITEGVEFSPAEYFQFDAALPLTLSFREDGSCALSCTEEDQQAFRDEIWQELKDGMLKLVEGFFDVMAQSEGMTIEELYALSGVEDLESLMALSGYTVDDMMEDALPREEFESYFEGVNEELNGEAEGYRTEGGVLYFDGATENSDLAEPIEYDFDGETLTLKDEEIELVFTRK